MKHLVAPLVAIICIVLGSVGGHYFKNRPANQADANSYAGESEASSHSMKEDGHGSQSAEKDDYGPGAHNDYSSNDIIYYKFSREFVVPVIKDANVRSLVILNINLEADAGISNELYSMEPKIRDNIMTTMIKLSNEGTVLDTITDVESYEAIRATILENVKSVIPNGIRNVLILDVARQDL